EALELQPQRWGGGRQLSQDWPISWIGRIPEDCHARKAGYDLLQELQPLPAELRGEGGHPGDVAARVCQAGDESGFNGVGGEEPRDYRDRARGLFGGKARWSTGGQDEIHLQVD